MPTSPTNKILKRVLVHDKYRPDRIGADPLWVRGRDEPAYRPFGDTEAKAVHDELVVGGRERFWDL
jgi:hypothetical protein